MFSSVSMPFASAALVNDVSYAYTQSNVYQFLLEQTLKAVGALGGAGLGTITIPGVGTIAGTVVGDFVAGLAVAKINDLAQYYAAGYTDDDWKTAVNESGFSHASGKFGTTVSSSDLSVSRPLYLDADTIANLNSLTADGYLMSYSNDPNRAHIVRGKPSSFYRGSYDWPYVDGNLCSSSFTAPQGNYTWQIDFAKLRYSSVSYVYLQRYVDGAWRYYDRNSLGRSTTDSETLVTSYPKQSHDVYLESGTYRFCCPVQFQSLSFSGTERYYGVEQFVELGDFTLTSQNSTVVSAPSNTRAAAFAQSVADYNATSSKSKLYIGTTDAAGTVNYVYSPNIFNESTLTFTEPVTGQQYLCTDWRYCYLPEWRGYFLDIKDGSFGYNGTSIVQVDLFYFDDQMFIVGFDQDALDAIASWDMDHLEDHTVQELFGYASFIDQYAYVIASQREAAPGDAHTHVYTSETITPPTCTEPGLRRYTCLECGHTQDQKVPATGHQWAVTETVETVFNDAGDVVTPGYTLYTCAECGETYKQWSETGQPGPPSGSDTGGTSSSSSGSSLWDKIKDLFSAGLVAGIKAVLKIPLDALNSALGSFGDRLAELFSFVNADHPQGDSDYYHSPTTFEGVSVWD